MVLDLDGQLTGRGQDESLQLPGDPVFREREILADVEIELDVLDHLDAAGLKN